MKKTITINGVKTKIREGSIVKLLANHKDYDEPVPENERVVEILEFYQGKYMCVSVCWSTSTKLEIGDDGLREGYSVDNIEELIKY